MFPFLSAQRSAGDLLCSVARTPWEFRAAPSPQEFRATPSCRVSSVSGSLRVMAAVFGKVGEFDVAREEWPQYVERLGHLFEANRIEGEGKRGPFSSRWLALRCSS